MEKKETKTIKKPRFRTYWEETEDVVLDYSREEEPVFTEIEPLAIDEETGEILNKTNKRIFKETGKENIFDKIQSFKDAVDIYKILGDWQASGKDPALIHRAPVFIGDLYDIPANINEFNNLMKKAPEKIKKAIEDGNLNQLIQDAVKAELLKLQQNETPTNTETKGDEK